MDMNATIARTLAVAATLAVLPAALAHGATASDATASASLAPVASASSFSVADPAPVARTEQPSLLLTTITMPSEEVLGVHYRPRSSGWGRHYSSMSVTQIHAGFFDPEGAPGNEFLLGVRGGPMVDPHVQLGLGLDWSHIVDQNSSVQRDSVLPGGQTITVKRDLSRASTHLFPIMAFAQFSGDDNMSLIPYFGGSLGYELMNISADNFQNNTSFDATYGGWGWQAWAGVGVPLSGQARLNGEVFVNQAELGRDVTDDATGDTVRETVKANGAGLRIGLAWGF
jgi:hypothetical protein